MRGTAARRPARTALLALPFAWWLSASSQYCCSTLRAAASAHWRRRPGPLARARARLAWPRPAATRPQPARVAVRLAICPNFAWPSVRPRERLCLAPLGPRLAALQLAPDPPRRVRGGPPGGRVRGSTPLSAPAAAAAAARRSAAAFAAAATPGGGGFRRSDPSSDALLDRGSFGLQLGIDACRHHVVTAAAAMARCSPAAEHVGRLRRGPPPRAPWCPQLVAARFRSAATCRS